MTRTSRARTSEASLYVVEPNSNRREVQESSIQEPPIQERPAEVGEIAQPDNADQMDADQADLDARLAGMAVLLRCALRVMKEYDASPSRRDRGRR
jgi:hypothetical protein